MSEAIKTPPTLANLLTRRDEILQLARQYGAYNVRVFGSLARGEALPGSDIDLLVNVRDGTSMFALVGLWLDLKTLLGHQVNVVDEQALTGDFRANALRDVLSLPEI